MRPLSLSLLIIIHRLPGLMVGVIEPVGVLNVSNTTIRSNAYIIARNDSHPAISNTMLNTLPAILRIRMFTTILARRFSVPTSASCQAVVARLFYMEAIFCRIRRNRDGAPRVSAPHMAKALSMFAIRKSAEIISGTVTTSNNIFIWEGLKFVYKTELYSLLWKIRSWYKPNINHVRRWHYFSISVIIVCISWK